MMGYDYFETCGPSEEKPKSFEDNGSVEAGLSGSEKLHTRRGHDTYFTRQSEYTGKKTGYVRGRARN